MGKRSRNFTGVAQFLKTITSAFEAPTPELTQNLHEAPPKEAHRPSPKKRKLNEKWDEIDVLQLVPKYTVEGDVPEDLKKYFAQRHRYFSLYDDGCLLDEEGWYSVTPEKIAEQIAERCRCDTILDAFCGVGGNAIAFARTCHRVIAIDNSPTRLAIARHNATIYGVQNRIEFILSDYLDFARSYASLPSSQRTIDAVFLSPPWGGPSYITGTPTETNEGETQPSFNTFSLRSILPIPGDELFHLSRQVSHNVAYFLPRNVDLNEVSGLLKKSPSTLPELISTQREELEYVEVEEEYMGNKLKAVTCYFGGLASGQEHNF